MITKEETGFVGVLGSTGRKKLWDDSRGERFVILCTINHMGIYLPNNNIIMLTSLEYGFKN